MSDSGKDAVRETVRRGYAEIAGRHGSCCAPKSCCGSRAGGFASGIGYTDDDLTTLPEGAEMGLGCGNPTALASLRWGEVVLDLGCGGGLDVFIAGRKVGPDGRAIGVDMTPEMLGKARSNIRSYAEKSGLDNVEFRLGEIEHLPVADCSADVVISNCVINLSPEKRQVWREVFRVLKPGGRVAVSDLALLRPLPDAVRESVAALVGCVAGAVLIEETERMLLEAGFTDVRLEPKNDYIDSMTEWSDPLYRGIIAGLPAGRKLSEYVTSLNISARKPS